MAASRNPDKLYGPLRKRYFWMLKEWDKRYPNAPKPFLTCTFRPPQDQIELVRQRRSNAQPGESPHNYEPAYAFDIAFAKEMRNGKATELDWGFDNFQKWGELAEEIGLEWGGRWAGLVDGPHVQIPNWRAVRDGKITHDDLVPLPQEKLKPPIIQNVDEIIIKGGFYVKNIDNKLIVEAK